MDGIELIQKAFDAGLAVWVIGNKLRVRGQKRLEPLAMQMLSRKVELITILDGHDYCALRAAALLSHIKDSERQADLRELFEHRAGVCEYDGGLSRVEAERIAFDELRAAMREFDDLT